MTATGSSSFDTGFLILSNAGAPAIVAPMERTEADLIAAVLKGET